MSEWQSMDTAPKDGSDVLLFIPDGYVKGRRVRIGSFSHSVHTNNGKVTYDNSSWHFGGVLHLVMGSDPQPTKWMPLPVEPPFEEKPEATDIAKVA